MDSKNISFNDMPQMMAVMYDKLNELERIIQSNRNHTEIDIVELLRTIMESQNVDKVSFIPQD